MGNDPLTHPLQQVFTALYNTDDNALVAAPTGSGKTVCAEFAIMRMFTKAAGAKARAVYIAPLPQLAQERYKDWTKKFSADLKGDVGAKAVTLLTGETAVDLKLLEKGDIIVSTPENWDMLSRRWKQRRNVQNVALFIVDELHLIGGQNGPSLEVVTSRMRYISAQTEKAIRIVGLCTSLANAKDLGEWIGAGSHSLFNFAPGVRPVPLAIHIQGFDIANFEARMKAMSRPTYSAITAHAKDAKPAVVFVPTRKHARLTALDLLTFAAAEGEPARFLQVEEADLEPYLERVNDKALKHSLQYGVAFIHEAMSQAEQDVVNVLFSSGAIQVMVATASVCWGLTVGAHLVVVMGTQYYEAGGHGGSNYPLTDLMQMLGRAGRPQVDDTGRAVIMCHTPSKEYYKKFLFEPFPIESHLDHFLADHFCAEVRRRAGAASPHALLLGSGIGLSRRKPMSLNRLPFCVCRSSPRRWRTSRTLLTTSPGRSSTGGAAPLVPSPFAFPPPPPPHASPSPAAVLLLLFLLLPLLCCPELLLFLLSSPGTATSTPLHCGSTQQLKPLSWPCSCRIAQNPNYYNLNGTSHRHLSDHLSDLVENTLTDLEQSKVISIEDEMDLSPLNLGEIAPPVFHNGRPGSFATCCLTLACVLRSSQA